MTVPNNVYLLKDPSCPNAKWDHMFNTGHHRWRRSYASETCSRASSRHSRSSRPTTLRTSSQYYPNIRDLWGHEYNVTFAKNTTIREGWALQFRAETFNMCNHPIFAGDPNLDPTSANFGKILRYNGQTNVPRQIQLGLRFTFYIKTERESNGNRPP